MGGIAQQGAEFGRFDGKARGNLNIVGIVRHWHKHLAHERRGLMPAVSPARKPHQLPKPKGLGLAELYTNPRGSGGHQARRLWLFG
jgi:hypothetical protein